MVLAALAACDSKGEEQSTRPESAVDIDGNAASVGSIEPDDLVGWSSSESKWIVSRIEFDDLVGWSPAESKWIVNRKNAAMLALEAAAPRLLVLPVHGGKNAFDPIERTLITRLISDRIGRTADWSVANPNLVSQFFGLHAPKYDTAEIIKLAKSTGSQNVLVLQAEHNRDGRFELRLSLIYASDWTTVRSKSWSGLEYSDSSPPSVAIGHILDEIKDFATDTGSSKDEPPSTQAFEPENFRFPSSLDELKSESTKSDLYAVAHLQLLGMLHAGGAFNETRNQLFERSLVRLRRVSEESPYQRYFTARAYAYLDRRPAALHALGTPQTSHGRALLATLNGNLPALRKEVEEMGTSVLDFMAWRDLFIIESTYGQRKEREIVEQFIDEVPAWAPFVYRALQDTSKWANYSAMTLKVGLDLLLPAEAVTLQSFYQNAAATGDTPSEFELTQLLFKHIETFSLDQMREWAYEPDNHTGVSELDILDLARTYAVANHIRHNEDDLEIRDLPEKVLARIHQFDAFFSGHPAVTLQLSRALRALAENTSGVEMANHVEDSQVAARNGFSWTGQMTKDSIAVARDYLRYFRNYLPNDRFIGAPFWPLRYTEWPQGMDWFHEFSHDAGQNGAFERCNDYTWTQFWCLKQMIFLGEEDTGITEADRAEILARNAHRFIGNPQRDVFEAELAKKSGDLDAELRQLRERIEAGGADWRVYYALGRALKRHGEYQAAQEVWLSYPAFNNPGQGVSLTDDNHASAVGSMLYWIGQYELALPLLEISAASRTGSGGSMGSGNRLALINGDLASAEQWSAARVRRYGSKYGVRDLQQILHIQGQSDLAWSVFEQAQSSTQDAEMWSGVLVGHRMASATIGDIQTWIEDSDSRKSAQVRHAKTHEFVDLAQRYVLLAGTMDRTPGPEFAEAVAALRNGKGPEFGTGIMEVGGEGDEKTFESTPYVEEHGWSIHHDALVGTPAGGQSAERGQIIDTRYEMLAKAMTAFLNDDFEESFKLLNDTSYYYYLDEYLPYYAFSAAIAERADHIAAVLEAREPALEKIRQNESMRSSERGYRFDEDLTYAVLAAFDGHHEAAIRYLGDALNNRPYIEERTVYPYYQVVDLADRLYDHTGKDIYRDYALQLSQRHTVVLPMYSWAYYVVAKHSRSRTERVDAIASGLKLDPLSHRGSLLPSELVEEARKVLANHGAPYLRRSSELTSIGT